ncbi:MAG: hypothetical protein QOD05_2262 [Microbacteriaceae bacterium]|nr:hypothetical protein [Microbacteriaceae bacterium]
MTWGVARTVGPAGYAVFAVFWSALFLIVGVLFGLQQEATRATVETTTRSSAVRSRSSIWVFVACLALVLVLIVLTSSVWWATPSLGSTNLALVWPIALGAGANCLVAAASGVMAGAQLWRQLAAIISLDGILRAVGVFVVLPHTHDVFALAWVVIAPFPLSLAIVFASSPRTLIARARVHLSYLALLRNSLQTMLAASASALLINGFPLILSFFAAPTDQHRLGAVILSITLTRAPILVPLMALQSYLVTRFSVRPEGVARLILKLFVAIVVVIGVLSIATALWGTELMGTVFGAGFSLPSVVLVSLVASSGLIGALCVTGPAVLARAMHGGYAMGWIVASVVALGVLFTPLPIESKAVLALSVGPLTGLALHLALLLCAHVRADRSFKMRSSTRSAGGASV